MRSSIELSYEEFTKLPNWVEHAANNCAQGQHPFTTPAPRTIDTINNDTDSFNDITVSTIEYRLLMIPPEVRDQVAYHLITKTNNSMLAYVYTISYINELCDPLDFTGRGRRPAIEHIIMKDSLWTELYAINIIKERWPEAEHIILTNIYSAYEYAVRIIRGRWPEAEEILRTDHKYWSKYLHFTFPSING